MKWDFTPVCIYAQAAPRIIKRAHELGYAIGLHGSMTRDFDLIAVPWIDDAASPEALVLAIAEEVGGFVPKSGEGEWEVAKPEQKPHGRVAWSICWGGAPFIDLSVMPREGKR